MAKNRFLLISLQEDKAKMLAQVISNESCRKILDYLAEKEASEEELAENLELPMSTVHYNIQQLLKSEMVSSEEFHYSKRGREVKHYKLANKYIIIAPKESSGIPRGLKSLLPVSLIALVGAGLVQLYSKYFGQSVAAFVSAPASAEQLKVAAVAEGANLSAEIPQAASTSPQYALWFLFGSVFVIALCVIFELIRTKVRK